MGRRPGGVRERHVERDRLRYKLFVRSHRCAQGGRLLQGAKGKPGVQVGDRAATGTMGYVGPNAHIRGPFLRRQHIQVCTRFLSLDLLAFLPPFNLFVEVSIQSSNAYLKTTV